MNANEAAREADELQAYADRQGTGDDFDWFDCVNRFMAQTDPAALRAQYVTWYSGA